MSTLFVFKKNKKNIPFYILFAGTIPNEDTACV